MTASNTTLLGENLPASPLSDQVLEKTQKTEIDDRVLETLSESDRDRLILEQLERVDHALVALSPELKVLLALKTAASWAITSGTKLGDFLNVTQAIWRDTEEDVAQFAVELTAAGGRIPTEEQTP